MWFLGLPWKSGGSKASFPEPPELHCTRPWKCRRPEVHAECAGAEGGLPFTVRVTKTGCPEAGTQTVEDSNGSEQLGRNGEPGLCKTS